MSHFAKIKNGIVEQVIVAEQDFIDTLEGTWVQTSYNTYGNQHKLNGKPLRANYAKIGSHYDAKNDVFYEPQPYPSWTLNQSTWLWGAPQSLPDLVNYYRWDESTTSWIEVK